MSRALGVHDALPDACATPSDEPIVAGGPRSVSGRKIPPRCTRSQDPKNAIEHAPIPPICGQFKQCSAIAFLAHARDTWMTPPQILRAQRTLRYTLSKSARQARLNGWRRSESGLLENSAIASFRRSTLGFSQISTSPLITASASSMTLGGAKSQATRRESGTP